jgi:RNA polymerase sigma factor (sigma-70 family)
MGSQLLNGVVGRMSAMLAVSESADRSDEELIRRFLARRDHGAFEAIVRRHGPMVLGVCRRVLSNLADAEDAFQATFIVLLRKANALRRPERLAGWLYQVAYRVARKARQRANADEQRFQRTPLAEVPVEDPVPRLVWNELRPIFDDELNRLPEKLRLPVLLCFLEGLSKREAARRLAWPEGTVSSRLQTARERLRVRLSARGLALSAGVFQLALFQGTAPAAIPLTLMATTMQTANTTAAVSTSAAALLAEGVVQTMFQAKMKVLAAGVMAVALFGGGAGMFMSDRGASNAVYAQGNTSSAQAVAETNPVPAHATAAAALIQQIVSGEDKTISDEDFIRRAYLDFLGRLPTVAEVQEFQKNSLLNRRTKLIDSLIENQPYDAWVKRYLDLHSSPFNKRLADYENAFRAQTNAPAVVQFLDEIGEKNSVDKELVRRLWLDLFGVPPTPTEIQDYRKDPAAVRRIQQFAKLMNDARLENQKVEIESLREKLLALEAQHAGELARRKEKEARDLYQKWAAQVQIAWEWDYLRQLSATAKLREADLTAQIAKAQADLEQHRERVLYSERMHLKGYLTRAQLDADRAQLASVEQQLKAAIAARQILQLEESVRTQSAAADRENEAMRSGKGSEAARDRALTLLAEARVQLAQVQMKQELANLVSLRQREVDRIAKAVEQKLLPPADLERARKALDEAKKRLADAEK